MKIADEHYYQEHCQHFRHSAEAVSSGSDWAYFEVSPFKKCAMSWMVFFLLQ
jgi:hypothetical protein